MGTSLYTTGGYANVQPSSLPLVWEWTPAAGPLPEFPVGSFACYVKNALPSQPGQQMLGVSFSTVGPSANRDDAGNGSYYFATNDGKWNIEFLYHTN